MIENPWQQGIYWRNFPIKPKHSLDFLEKHINRIRLNKKKYPFIIFTGIGRINFNFIYNNPQLLEFFKKNSLHLYLFEPVSYYFKDQEHTHSYYSEFHNSQNSLAYNSEFDSIDEFAADTGIKIFVHHCDYNFNSLYRKRYKNIIAICDDTFIKIHSMPPRDLDFQKDIKLKFWCVNGRYTPHRHLIMNYLANKDGDYVWRFQCDIEKLKDINWIEPAMPFDTFVENNQILNNSYFKIDRDFKKIKIEDINYTIAPSANNEFNMTMAKSISRSFCVIVNETRFAQPTGNISEKTFNAVNTLSPFVLVAPPRSLEYFKKLGFKTFSDFWDESYDLEENHTNRMLKIFETIDFINSKSINELKSMYQSMNKILNYNRKRMNSFHKKDVWLYE